MAITVNIKTTDLDLTEALEDYLTTKISKLEQLVDENDTSAIADVEVGKSVGGQRSGEIYRAEINLHVAGAYLYAESEKDDIRAAIDEVKDEMVRELRKNKEKKETLFRKGARKMKEMIRGFSSEDTNE